MKQRCCFSKPDHRKYNIEVLQDDSHYRLERHQGVFVIEVPGLQNFTDIGTVYNWNYSTIPYGGLLIK